ncbi:hypothetical protein TWF225_001448 [Orbilia oligospora]|uniref:phosphatidylserine decarboxylase n=1 Tax=Orbilia oligospora TaxID=2813651 RepID=A0A7C8P4Y9_ORBOL|nr:hypothetical protein TWF751_000596 [Orbilia oligospora]KAF3191302.1 hypothetical protein TWF225_001448 [Orbilia oligospora]KAF3259202.1 hypothetical protein TWF217_005338 [Orbilia oligospora]KAF3269479.1 hypothetical protein TWF128_005704 [Orbilia oligospora]KAF3296614.1 hypothetical protein TWF132_010199 [Orbilia oligospora]
MGLFAFVLGYVSTILDEFMGYCKLIQNREVGWPTVDRKTGELKREQQPIWKKIKLILLFNPITEWIDRTKLMRLYLHDNSLKEGKKERSPRSKSKIRPFIDFYHINMEEFTPSDVKDYATFEDFFVREHARGSRPIYEEGDDSFAIVPSDCRVVVYPSVHLAQKLWIKGQHFSIANLLGDPSIAESFADGPVASFRLSPQDYHRYHAPVTGTVKWYKQFSGEYYNVDPWNLRSHIDVLTSNARCAVCFETEKYGDVIFVAIGASDVGTVKFNEDTRIPGRRIHKGQEIGRFEFGGSSILVVFQKGRILFDEDLLNLSNERIMVDVEVGMSLGRLQAKGGEKRGSVDEASGKVNEKRQKVNEMHEKAGETETYAQAVSEGGKKSDSEKEDTQTTKKAAKALRIT